MTTEEKAKAYDKALEIAREINRTYPQDKVCETIFPELKESEDERIKYTLKKVLKDANKGIEVMLGDNDYKRCIAWLEQQGEQKSEQKCYEKEECNQCEYNFTCEHIEPKFKVGDWVITDNTDKGAVVLIVGVTESSYTLANGMGFSKIYVDKCWRKWTIQDAKEGDILLVKPTKELVQQLILFGGIDKDNRIIYQCRILNGKFSINGGLIGLEHNYFLPATKEQREQLFNAMADEGYHWDAEKKELKKIENNLDACRACASTGGMNILDCSVCKDNPNKKELKKTLMDYSCLTDTEMEILNFAMYFHEDRCKPESEWQDEVKMVKDAHFITKPAEWSEEDKSRLKSCIAILQASDGHDTINTKWLKSLKDRVQPKQEWSEEDEKKLQRIIDFLWNNRKGDTDTIYQQEQDIDWLKALRPQKQWKPSEEQMDALNKSISFVTDDFGENPTLSEILRGLYNDLKKF